MENGKLTMQRRCTQRLKNLKSEMNCEISLPTFVGIEMTGRTFEMIDVVIPTERGGTTSDEESIKNLKYKVRFLTAFEMTYKIK